MNNLILALIIIIIILLVFFTCSTIDGNNNIFLIILIPILLIAFLYLNYDFLPSSLKLNKNLNLNPHEGLTRGGDNHPLRGWNPNLLQHIFMTGGYASSNGDYIIGGSVSPSGKEYEARWSDIDPNIMRKKIIDIGGKLVHDNKKYFRYTYNLPNGYARVRQEYKDGKIIVTATSKTYEDPKFPKETEITTTDTLEQAHKFMLSLNLEKKAFSETYREKYSLEGCNEIVIDLWPGLNHILEIDCDSEEHVFDVADKLGLKKENATFGAVTNVYVNEYGLPAKYFNEEMPEHKFSSFYDITKDHVTKNKDKLKLITDKYKDM